MGSSHLFWRLAEAIRFPLLWRLAEAIRLSFS
jgi:hypothetical protein